MLIGAFSVITNLRMDLFEALVIARYKVQSGDCLKSAVTGDKRVTVCSLLHCRPLLPALHRHINGGTDADTDHTFAWSMMGSKNNHSTTRRFHQLGIFHQQQICQRILGGNPFKRIKQIWPRDTSISDHSQGGNIALSIYEPKLLTKIWNIKH